MGSSPHTPRSLLFHGNKAGGLLWDKSPLSHIPLRGLLVSLVPPLGVGAKYDVCACPGSPPVCSLDSL